MRHLVVFSLLLAACSGDITPEQEVDLPICQQAVPFALCKGAANHWNGCCANTPGYTALQLCENYDLSGWDPVFECQLLEQTSCEIIHDSALLAGVCCCPNKGQICNLRHIGECYTPDKE